MIVIDPAATVSSFLSTPGSRLQVSAHARGVCESTGSVVMDVSRGKYFALNVVGAEMWSALEDGADGTRLLDRLEARFEVERERLRGDVERLLVELVDRGLLVPATAPIEATSLDTSVVEAMDRPGLGPARGATVPLEPRPPAEVKPPSASPAAVALAWVGLLAADAMVHVAGFRRLHQIARIVPPRPRRSPPSSRTVAATCRAVDRAAGLYFKRAWCLQRSFLTTMLLRARGVPADLVVGVRSAPFMAHAWVEHEGRVINDRASVKSFYREIERCGCPRSIQRGS